MIKIEGCGDPVSCALELDPSDCGRGLRQQLTQELTLAHEKDHIKLYRARPKDELKVC